VQGPMGTTGYLHGQCSFHVIQLMIKVRNLTLCSFPDAYKRSSLYFYQFLYTWSLQQQRKLKPEHSRRSSQDMHLLPSTHGEPRSVISLIDLVKRLGPACCTICSVQLSTVGGKLISLAWSDRKCMPASSAISYRCKTFWAITASQIRGRK